MAGGKMGASYSLQQLRFNLASGRPSFVANGGHLLSSRGYLIFCYRLKMFDITFVLPLHRK